jgi:predicted RNA-binding protein associated with RNAse of E/G family
MQVRLVKPVSGKVVTYDADIIRNEGTHILVRTVWGAEMGRVDKGCVVFEPGDYLYEHFYTDRWYSVFEIHASDGQLKGWYCDLARPALFHAEYIESEDLALDVCVSPDRQTITVLDEDDYAHLELDVHEPVAHESVQAALIQLRALAQQGRDPFRPHDV